MNSENPMRVRLTGVLEHTASSVEVGPDGSLLVEFYDFSDDAQRFMGNDVACLLHVEPAEKERTLSLLESETNSPDNQHSDSPDIRLLHLMEQKFSDYFEVKEWFEDQGISFRSEFDSWA